nr:retrotransposon protein, putative, Ty1-copia subclass [Tanacetum cinerariifolium]
MNRTRMEKVRCMLSHANSDKDFWVEAATTATYLINCYPHRSLDGNIPEILWLGNSVDYYNLRVFGCPVYVHVNERKLVHRAVKCIFLGYGSSVKGYLIWYPDPKYCKIIHSRDVTFKEDVIINLGKDFVPPYNVDNNHTEGKVEFKFDVENSTHTQPPFNDEHIKTQDDGNMPISQQSQPQTEYLLARDRKRRQVNRPPRLEDYQCDLVVTMEEDVESLHKNETWELVKLPKEKCMISCKWLLNLKDGIPEVESNQYKARHVVRRFDQREGINFNEVFSSVVRRTSIRVLLSIVSLQDLELEQLDVKTAFHHGHLEEEIYVEQPEGFKVPGKEDHMCILKKLLYDLKQSHRQWYKMFDSFMIGHGYDRCGYDEYGVKDQLSNEFDTKDLGAAKRILGMEIRRDQKIGKLTLSQSNYISKVLKKFNMSSCKPVPTPLAPHFKLSSHECLKSDKDKEDMSRVPYSSVVGSLMYAMVCTCPDLARAVSVVSRYMHNPGRASPNGVVGYVDSGYAGDLDARKSLSSIYLFYRGSKGGYMALRNGTEVTKDQVKTPSSQSTTPLQPSVVQSESETPVSKPVVAPEGISLPELSLTCMTLELADRLVFKPIGIAKDVLVKTGRALIDVHKGELTLRIRNEAITYNLDQTSRYSSNYNQMTAKKIDVIDMACEEYSQEVLGFSDVTASGNPTPYDDSTVSTTSPTLNPFGDSDFLLFEEADAFLGLEDVSNSPEFNPFYYDLEGDILLLEAILNSKPLPPLLNHEQ